MVFEAIADFPAQRADGSGRVTIKAGEQVTASGGPWSARVRIEHVFHGRLMVDEMVLEVNCRVVGDPAAPDTPPQTAGM